MADLISSLEESEGISCSVCFELYNAEERRPMILPCGHTFCKQCTEGFHQPRCPLCNEELTPDTIRPNFGVSVMLNVLERHRKEVEEYRRDLSAEGERRLELEQQQGDLLAQLQEAQEKRQFTQQLLQSFQEEEQRVKHRMQEERLQKERDLQALRAQLSAQEMERVTAEAAAAAEEALRIEREESAVRERQKSQLQADLDRVKRLVTEKDAMIAKNLAELKSLGTPEKPKSATSLHSFSPATSVVARHVSNVAVGLADITIDNSKNLYSWVRDKMKSTASFAPLRRNFGDFAIAEGLGRNRRPFHRVVRCTDLKFQNQEKVLKRVGTRNPSVTECFREAMLLHRLSHPNILKLSGVCFDENGRALMVMPYGGNDLMYLIQSGRCTPEIIPGLGRALFSALAYCHAAHVVHRDITAASVLFDGARWTLCSWQWARSTLDGRLSDQLLPEARYLAPDRQLPTSSPKAHDVYAAGVVVAEALLGRLVTEADLSDVSAALTAAFVADSACQLVTAVLRPEADDRLTAVRALTSLYISGDAPSFANQKLQEELRDEYVPEFAHNKIGRE